MNRHVWDAIIFVGFVLSAEALALIFGTLALLFVNLVLACLWWLRSRRARA